MIRFSDKVKSISMWYANLNGYALPLSPEQLLNAVVAWVDEYGGDHIYFDNPPEGTEVNVGDIKISTTNWEVQQWNGREWESLGSIAGVAATIEIGDVETLPAGSPAYVENEGTEFAAVLKFGIPKGDKGDKGEQGERGEQGEQGEPGRDGTNGKDGTDGRDGAAASIEVAETTTLPAGSSATVENIGTSSAARLKFGIPQGQPGQTGQVIFRVINVTASGTIGAEDLSAIASSPEGVVLVDDSNRRYECSGTPSGSYIYASSTGDNGLTLYVYTISSSDGTYSRTSSTIDVPPPTVIPAPSFSDNENSSVSQSSNGYSYEAANMSFNDENYPVPVNLPVKAGSGIAMDIGSDGKSIEISLDQNETSTEVELSGASGTVDEGTLALLQRGNPSVYISCDNEIYYYSDNMSDSGYLVYTHVGMTNSNTYYVKTITIQISTKTWTRSQQQIGNFSDSGNYPNVTVGSASTATNATHATSADSATNATNATNATHATSADSSTSAANDGLGRNIANTYVLKGEEGWRLTLYACTISFSPTAAIYFCYPNQYFSFDIDDIANDLFGKGIRSNNQAFPVVGMEPSGGQVVGMYSKNGSSITLAVITGKQMTEMALPNGTLNKSAYV